MMPGGTQYLYSVAGVPKILALQVPRMSATVFWYMAECLHSFRV